MPRLYFTGRRKIPRNKISLVFHPGRPPSFEATIDLSSHRRSLSKTARVFVEAFHNTMLQRFDFGTVADCRPRDSLLLSQFDEDDRPNFRVRVVKADQDVGVVLASCERINAAEPDSRGEGGRSMLELCPKPESKMRGELWRLAESGGGYQLWYNKDVARIAVGIKNKQPEVLGLILPAAVREILARTHCWEEISSEPTEWTRFGERLSGEPFPKAEPGEELSKGNIEEWIDEVIAAFCRKRAHFVERIAEMEESRT